MKKLILFIPLLICSIITFAQEIPTDSITGLYTYKGNISYTSTKQEAFNIVKKYLSETKYFQLILDSKDFSKLLYNASTPVSYKKDGSVANTGFSINKTHQVTSDADKLEPAGYVSYSIEVLFSDKTITYVIKNLSHHGTGEIGNGGPLEKYPECGSEKIGTIPNWNLYKQQVNKDILATIESIKSLFQN